MASRASVISSLLTTRLLIRRNGSIRYISTSDTDKPASFKLIRHSVDNGVHSILLNSPKTRYNFIINQIKSHTTQHQVLLLITSCFCATWWQIRNALSLEMLTELSSAFYSINETKEARCVLLSAEGHVFSAGHNLKVLKHFTVIMFSDPH
jgi:hypothetical protein